MTGQSDHTFNVCAAVAKHWLVIEESVRSGSCVRSILCVQPLVTLCLLLGVYIRYLAIRTLRTIVIFDTWLRKLLSIILVKSCHQDLF